MSATGTISGDPTAHRRRAAEMVITAVPDAAYRKWAARAPPWTDVGVVEAWHNAEPVHYPSAANGAVCRYHEASRMLLLVRQGALVSCYPLANRSRTEQQYITQQVER